MKPNNGMTTESKYAATIEPVPMVGLGLYNAVGAPQRGHMIALSLNSWAQDEQNISVVEWPNE